MIQVTTDQPSNFLKREAFLERFPHHVSCTVPSAIFQKTEFQDFLMSQCMGKFSYNFFAVPPVMLFESQTDCTLVDLYIGVLKDS